MKDRFFQGCSKFKRQEILQTDLQNERKVSKVVNKKKSVGDFYGINKSDLCKRKCKQWKADGN
jgi:hypothetical protein